MKLKPYSLTVIGIIIAGLIFPTTVQCQLGFGPEGKALYWHQTYDAIDVEPLCGGGLAYVWSGTDLTGRKRVWLQIVESDGSLSFGDQPPVISPEGIDAMYPQVAAHPDGGMYIGWTESRQNSRYREKLQRFDSDGNAIWAEGGIEIANVQLGQPNVELSVDSEGGVLVAPVTWNNLYHQNVIGSLFAYTEDGNLKEGWPEQGLTSDTLMIKEIQPDSRGGFWIRKKMDFNGISRLNRISADCQWQWENDIVLESPVDLIESIECKSTGDFLFACLRNGWGGTRVTGFNVYDLNGQLLRSELVPVTEDTSNLAYWLVSQENQIFLVYGLGYDCEGGWGQYGSVRFIRYDPLSENDRFPWGERGIPFPEPDPERATDLSNISMIKVDNVLMISSTGQHDYLNLLTTNVEPSWLGDAREVDGISRFVDSFTEGEEAWVNFGEPVRIGRFTGDGEMATGDDPVIVRPPLTSREGSVAFQLTGDRLCMQMDDPERGLCGQILDSNGNLTSPLNLSPIGIPGYWLSGSFASGVIGDIQWFFDDDADNANRFRFTFLNDQNQLIDTLTVDMESPNFHYLSDNGEDRLLFYCYYQNIGATCLYSLDLHGETMESAEVIFPGANISIGNAWYWPGQGWLVAMITSNQNEAYIQLFTDWLQPRWLNPIHLDQKVYDVSPDGDQLQLAGLRYFAGDTCYIGCLARLRPNGNISDTASVSTFNADVPRFSGQTTRTHESGNTWYLFQYGRESYIQLVSFRNLQRRLGDTGLRISAAPNTSHLALDAEGGAWLAWSDTSGNAKILHLDNEGRPWQGNYPIEGYDLFDESDIYIEHLLREQQSDHLWAVGRKRTVFNNYNVLYGYKAQLVSDEWLSDKNTELIHPSSLILSSYPNPFNSSTTISYSLPMPGRYALDVIDLQGRLVARLSDGWKETGSYREVLNGNTLSGGRYFVKLGNHNTTAIQPVIIVK